MNECKQNVSVLSGANSPPFPHYPPSPPALFCVVLTCYFSFFSGVLFSTRSLPRVVCYFRLNFFFVESSRKSSSTRRYGWGKNEEKKGKRGSYVFRFFFFFLFCLSIFVFLFFLFPSFSFFSLFSSLFGRFVEAAHTQQLSAEKIKKKTGIKLAVSNRTLSRCRILFRRLFWPAYSPLFFLAKCFFFFCVYFFTLPSCFFFTIFFFVFCFGFWKTTIDVRTDDGAITTTTTITMLVTALLKTTRRDA